MVSMLNISGLYRGLELQLGQTKKIRIYCFSTKHAALRSKSRNWLAWNQDDVSKWSDMSIPWIVDSVS